VAAVAIACDGDGSVASVALRQGRELAKHFAWVGIVSDGLPRTLPPGLEGVPAPSARFRWLRRLAHVPRELAFCIAARRALKKLHQGQRLSLAIFHGHPAAAIAGESMRRKLGVPYALVTHGDIFDRPKGTYDWRLTALYRSLTPRAYRGAELVVALSPHMADCAVRGGARREVVHLLPNGIDPCDIGLEASGGEVQDAPRPRRTELQMLYVGSLAEHKGIGTLVAACGFLGSENVPFSLTIVGAGPDERSLRRQAADGGADDRIRFLGSRRRSELGELYRRADVVCVPSWSDPLPTVVLEALAAGTPVVGSTVGGIPFMVEDGHNGRLVPPADAVALAATLRDLAAHPEDLEGLKSRARGSVLPRFSWVSVGERLRDLVERAASRGGGA
jgi:glycosyltransferase involved in cell wall biosynthesis